MIDYAKIGQEIGELVTTKQKFYGNSFGNAGKVMLILYPNGIGPDQVDDALTIVRMIDKLFRIATKKDALGESPYRDIAGYAILAIGRDEADRLSIYREEHTVPSRCVYHQEKPEPTCCICKIVNADQGQPDGHRPV